MCPSTGNHAYMGRYNFFPVISKESRTLRKIHSTKSNTVFVLHQPFLFLFFAETFSGHLNAWTLLHELEEMLTPSFKLIFQKPI